MAAAAKPALSYNQIAYLIYAKRCLTNKYCTTHTCVSHSSLTETEATELPKHMLAMQSVIRFCLLQTKVVSMRPESSTPKWIVTTSLETTLRTKICQVHSRMPACQAWCDGTATCGVFTMNKGNRCWLKSAAMLPTRDTEYTSWVRR